MLFFVSTALAAIVLGWPCQRLNWAWRQVWVTCSINAIAPAAAATGTGGPVGFSAGPSHLPTIQLDANGQFNPGAVGATYLCASSPNTGGSFLRNRCRRTLDSYGNLLKLCALPGTATTRGPNTLSPDYNPQSGHQPHVNNVWNLGFFAQACITPAATFPTPSNTCPGLQGWFTVVWNACQFSNAPGVGPVINVGPNSVNIPNYITAWGNPQQVLTSPSYLCGTAAAPAAPFAWNAKGASFKSSRCRKALDQFGRSAARCVPATVPNGQGGSDPLRYLAANLASFSPFCNV